MTTYSPDETRTIGARMGSRLSEGAVLLLDGPLASGKTTLAQGVARGLGVAEPVTSPTYTIVSEYTGRLPFYHIDLYRIGSEEDLDELGLEDILGREGVCVVEWPERAGRAMPPNATTITIRINDDGSRTITAAAALIDQQENR